MRESGEREAKPRARGRERGEGRTDACAAARCRPDVKAHVRTHARTRVDYSAMKPCSCCEQAAEALAGADPAGCWATRVLASGRQEAP